MPPIHWVWERHSISARGCAAKSVITVAPVAVNPAVLSKKASTTPCGPPGALPSTYGRMPRADRPSHVRTAARSASRRFGASSRRPARNAARNTIPDRTSGTR